MLAQLDPEVYQAQVVQARGNLENAIANEQNLEATINAQEAAIKTNEANLEKLKAADVYSQANTRRIIELADQGVFSKDRRPTRRQSGLDQSRGPRCGRRKRTSGANPSRNLPKHALRWIRRKLKSKRCREHSPWRRQTFATVRSSRPSTARWWPITSR